MKPFLLSCLVLSSLAVLAGCDRPAVSSAEAQATATPTPTPGDTTAADRMRAKNSEAAQATGDYLKEKGQQLKVELQNAGEQLGKDKEVWRRQLEEKKRQYQPQIDELKRKAATAGDQAKPEIDRQIAELEVQRQKADEKLAQLKAASGDAWEAFKARWKQEQAAETPKPTP